MSVASPDGTPPAPPRRNSRLSRLAHHPERSAALLALLIGFASVFSAVIAWRASLASIDASRYESLAVQQQARRLQIERELAGIVKQDERFINVFQEHALAARELQEQADALREGDPQTADFLDLDAQAHLAVARAVRPFFLGATGIELADDGSVPYDPDFVLRNLRAGHTELRELQSARTDELSVRADRRQLSLIGVAALIVAALFFLTIAQVTRTRVRVRQVFFAAGALLVGFGTVGFVIVEAFA